MFKWLLVPYILLSPCGQEVCYYPPPLPTVRTAIEKISNIQNQQSDAEEKKIQTRNIIEELVDKNLAARRVLGVHWRSLTDHEKNQFSTAYFDLLFLVYYRKIKHITEGEMAYKTARRRGKRYAIVYTKFIKGSNESYSIDYKMVETPEGWKIYDILVENISLSTTYKNSFSQLIKNKGFSGLMGKLNEKIASKKS